MRVLFFCETYKNAIILNSIFPLYPVGGLLSHSSVEKTMKKNQELISEVNRLKVSRELRSSFNESHYRPFILDGENHSHELPP